MFFMVKSTWGFDSDVTGKYLSRGQNFLLPATLSNDRKTFILDMDASKANLKIIIVVTIKCDCVFVFIHN